MQSMCVISTVFSVKKMHFEKMGEIVIIPTLSLRLKYPHPFKE